MGQAHGAKILTIEGMATDEIGSQLLDAFTQAGAVQCGFCTPGFVVSARSLLSETSAPDTSAIQRGLSGNLCRCTGYTKIIQAVANVSTTVQGLPSSNLAEEAPPIQPNGQGQFARPASVDEALQLLAQTEAKWQVIAGGTDILVQFEHRVKGLNLLDIGGITDLRTIRETGAAIHIGALSSYTDIIRSSITQTWASSLVEAAREVGGVQIQNMGTLGGNLVNASPAADGVPPLFVLDAQVVLKSIGGERTISVQEFATGPGRTIIEPDELLTQIIIPKQQHDGEEIAFFNKVGPRKAQTIAKASVAFRGWLQTGRLTNVRMAMGAVAPTVIRAPKTEAVLMSASLGEELLLQAGDVAHNECSPIDDVRSTAAYRRKLVRGLLIRNIWPYLEEVPV
jgi:CO/xanthine dehydrogenase FAD-binding subunit